MNRFLLTHFKPMFHFYTPWKRPPDVFWRYTNRTLNKNIKTLEAMSYIQDIWKDLKNPSEFHLPFLSVPVKRFISSHTKLALHLPSTLELRQTKKTIRLLATFTSCKMQNISAQFLHELDPWDFEFVLGL